MKSHVFLREDIQLNFTCFVNLELGNCVFNACTIGDDPNIKTSYLRKT